MAGRIQRRVFYSFHYEPDNWRVGQVRNIGAIEDNKPATDNDWETVKRGGDRSIQNWIDDQLRGRSCVVVLIGAETAGRKWVKYEIVKGWNDGKGVLGIHIHQLKDRFGQTCNRGSNPFTGIALDNGRTLDQVVKTYNPPGWDSRAVYQNIADNIDAWIETAIRIRNGG